ncbi:MAG: hypothetical protein IJU65_05320 [Desulfovibrio sp.]|nr:hypothetical protein [Desulfovibrio sp.]
MTLFLWTLCLLVAGASLCAILAVCPSVSATARAANLIGALGSATACLLGLVALVCSPWNASLSVHLPWGLPVGACALGLDALSRLFLLPVFGLGFVCAVSGGLSLRHERPEMHNFGAHWLFYFLLLLGLALVMTSRDAVLFMLAWELMSLAPFFLIDFNDGDSKVRDASWVYLTAAHLGAVALMAFFVLLWQTTGQTSLDNVGPALSQATPGLQAALFVLCVLGFGAKAGLAPLHIWLPEAHPAAPSHVSALLSGAMINAGLYGIVRSLGLLSQAGNAQEWWGWSLLFLGLGTGVMGILKATAQSNLKRLLAYSSVENMGLMTMGLGVGYIGHICGNGWIAVMGVSGALLHMCNHAAFKGLLFLCAGEVLHACGTVRMGQLGGVQKKMPLVGIAFAIGAASIACLPPCNGFAGELLIAFSLLDGPSLNGVERQMGLLVSFAGMACISGLAAALYAKAYGITFLGQPRSGFAVNAHPATWRTLWPLSLPAAVCLAGGLAAPAFFKLAVSAAHCALPLSDVLSAQGHNALRQAEHSLTVVSCVGCVGIALVVAILFIRKILLRGRRVKAVPTWSCGFQAASPRVQYTDAAFSEPMARIFGRAMGLKVDVHQDVQLFPQDGFLAIMAPDRLRTKLFTPLFQAVESLCNACKIMQHGKIHLYILYMLATVVGLLIWGLRV